MFSDPRAKFCGRALRVVVSAFAGNVRILISKTGFWTKLEQVVTHPALPLKARLPIAQNLSVNHHSEL